MRARRKTPLTGVLCFFWRWGESTANETPGYRDTTNAHRIGLAASPDTLTAIIDLFFS